MVLAVTAWFHESDESRLINSVNISQCVVRIQGNIS